MSMWYSEQLAYCSNVHPGICPEEIEDNLRRITATIRCQRGLQRMQIGLWINQEAASAYESPEVLDGLKKCLAEQQLDVVTLNGFPQGNFHEDVVKNKVYQPNWADKSRLNYTVSIANILAQCLPEDHSLGTISTLPLGYRLGWDEKLQHFACHNLCRFVMAMARIENNTGKQIRLCLEMEPGCVLENTAQVIKLFKQDLPVLAKEELIDTALLNRYLGVCYDVCHQAVMQENVNDSIARLHNAGIVIGKIQVSSALKVDKPADQAVRSRLKEFAEPKYLHQMSTRNCKGEFVFNDDLINALADNTFPDDSPWWIHFHIPIQINAFELDGISTSQDKIERLCECIKSLLPYAPHIEVETYTWEVLPAGSWIEYDNIREDVPEEQRILINGIVSELVWLEGIMKKYQLLKL